MRFPKVAALRMPSPKKPVAVRKLEGNPGKRALPKDFVAAAGEARRPEFVTGYAAEVWDRVCESMPDGVYRGADAELLAVYCGFCQTYRDAVLELSVQGHVIIKQTKDTSYPIRNPWSAVQSDVASKIASIGTRLGLDPISRESITAPDKRPASKFGQLVGIEGGKA